MSKKKKSSYKAATAPITISAGDMKKILDMAKNYYDAGNFEEANKVYRQILNHDPHHSESLYMMGMIAYKINRFEIAEQLIPLAIAAPQGNNAIYYTSLGDIFRDQGKRAPALGAYKKAILLAPNDVAAINNVAAVYLAEGKLDDAFEYCHQVLAINPDNALALFNIGLIHQERGSKDIAYEFFIKAIAAKNDFSYAHNAAGKILADAKKTEEAKKYFEQSIQHNKNYWDAYINMATLLKNIKQYEESIKYFKVAATIKNSAEIQANVGQLYKFLDDTKNSIKHYEAAIALDPNFLAALNNLGSMYYNSLDYEKSFVLYERVLKLDPAHATSLNNFAGLLKHMGQLEKAMDYYRKSMLFAPDRDGAYSNMLLAMIYTASVSPEEIYEASVEFGKRFADPFLRTRPMIRDKNPERKIRIGYVSPDLRLHAVNYFFENLLQNHNHDQFEIYAYSNVKTEDFVTERLKKEFDHWHNIRDKTDDEAANMIEDDQIDILVDMAGHTGDARLLIFARKPAPVQVSWLGYPATTGLKAIDYRITDHYAEPEGLTEHLNVETLWRLPQIFCCYAGHENNPEVIDHPPFEDNGYITFGCFNNFSKVTDVVLATWKKILLAVPDSRLLLEISSAEIPRFQVSLDERLSILGIPQERVMVAPRRPENQFVLYNKIDIALDPFPCAGGTTSMDTMWMGVPLITLAGRHFVSRMGVTILNNVGLPELIAENTDEYVAKAVALANDHNKLRAVRHNLRDRVLASPLMDQKLFAKNMEDAYRQMWRKWCNE